LRRKLGLVLAFLVFGLVAGASGLAVFMADLDRDPKHAMALAPTETLDGATSSIATAIAETEAVEATSAQKTSKAAGIQSPCRENIRENSAVDCTSGKERKPRSILALNERPAIAAVPIGHRVDPTVLPSEPATPVVVALPKDVTPIETPSAEPTEGAVTVTPTETPALEPNSPASQPATTPAITQERRRDWVQRHQRDHRQYASTPGHYREHREYASTPRYYGGRQAYRPGGYVVLW
jgi:hypothetical protein